MIAGSILSLTLVLAAAPLSEQSPPTVTLEELNAFVEAGNYHRIRIEKLGRILEATGEVELLAAYDGLPIVDFPGSHLRAGLQGLPKDHGLVIGDRVRFRGLIVDEGYACLQVWTYDFEKLPQVANAEAPDAAANAPDAAADADSTAKPAPPAEAAKSSEELLPKVTVADLEAAFADGKYRRVRQEMIGHRLYADAVVEKVGAWPLVRLSENWQAHLRSHSDDMGVKEGDRIRFHGLIVAEAYSAVTVWVERIEQLPADAK